MNYTLNFGAIKDSVFKFSAQKMLKEGKENDILKSFLSEIKNKPFLKAQYFLYKNIEEGSFDKQNLAERYLNQNLNLVKNFNWYNILQEHKVLRKLYFPEQYLVLGTIEKRDLYEAISTILESVTRPGFTNINKSEQAYDFVLNHLMTKKSLNESDNSKEKEDMPNIFSWKYLTQKAVNNFNERYSHLNEGEQRLLKVLLQEEKEKKLYLEHLVKDTLELIQKSKEKEKGLDEVFEKFENKINSIIIKESKNIDEDIMNIEELKDSLENI